MFVIILMVPMQIKFLSSRIDTNLFDRELAFLSLRMNVSDMEQQNKLYPNNRRILEITEEAKKLKLTKFGLKKNVYENNVKKNTNFLEKKENCKLLNLNFQKIPNDIEFLRVSSKSINIKNKDMVKVVNNKGEFTGVIIKKKVLFSLFNPNKPQIWKGYISNKKELLDTQRENYYCWNI